MLQPAVQRASEPVQPSKAGQLHGRAKGGEGSMAEEQAAPAPAVAKPLPVGAQQEVAGQQGSKKKTHLSTPVGHAALAAAPVPAVGEQDQQQAHAAVGPPQQEQLQNKQHCLLVKPAPAVAEQRRRKKKHKVEDGAAAAPGLKVWFME
jgi:hypothetical protein